MPVPGARHGVAAGASSSVHTPNRRACGEGTGRTSTRRHHSMPSYVRKSIVTLFAGAAVVAGVATPASAQPEQDGLVNVNIGDATVLENVGVAAQIAAEVCGLKVGPVAVLATQVDRTGDAVNVCTTDQGPVTISQNED